MDTSTPAALAVAPNTSYVDWPAIIAGSLIATAITIVLGGFGSAIGLSLTSAFSGKGISGTGVAIALGLWAIWIALSSLIAGGYVVGRMRRSLGDANAHEVQIRDGAHGLIVWAVSLVIGAMVAGMAVSGIASAGVGLARTAAPAVSAMTGESVDYAIDTLMRNDGQPSTLDDNTREQIGRVLFRSAANGEFNPADRNFVVRTISARAGVPAADVEQRINATIAQAKAARETAAAAAERARKLGVLIAFLTAASLAVAAAGAWWGASVGGRHRDENTDLAHFVRW